jgi:dihydrofolate reductase
MIIISAMSRDGVIGQGDGMPWDLPEEYAQFLEIITGGTVIMGRRSWEIFGSDLTSAHNVVVSRSANSIEGATVVNGIEAAVETARGFGKTVFSAGGAQIYKQTLPIAEAMYLSYIEGEFSGDARFPEFDPADWDVTERRSHPGFEFVSYRRVT